MLLKKQERKKPDVGVQSNLWSPTLLVGMQNGAASGNMIFSSQTQSDHPAQQTHSWEFHLRNANLCSYKNLNVNIRNNLFINHPKLETTMMSLSWGMDK